MAVKKIVKKYSIKSPFIHKGFHAKFYPIDFVQLIWNLWGKYEGYYYKAHISVFHNEYWDLYYLPEEFTKLREHYLKKIESEKRFLKKHIDDWKEACKRVKKTKNELEKACKKGDNSKNIIARYKEFVKEYLFEYALAAPIQEACGFQPEQWILPEIKRYTQKYKLDFQDTISKITAPTNISFVTKEEIELLKIAKETQKEEKKLLSRLKKHQKKWFWLRNNYSDIKVLSQEFFAERVKEEKKISIKTIDKKIDNLKNFPKKAKEEKTRLFKKYPPSQKLRLFTKINALFAEMQDVRKAIVLQANHFHNIFLERISKEYKKEKEDLWYYTYHELMKSIKTKKFLPNKEIQKRKSMLIEVESEEEKIIFSGEEAKEFLSHLKEKTKEATQLKGLVAQRGVVTGKVRIVLKSEDLIKVKEGDILVSSMTRPEMTAAMKKASAFITDEGGITSHAAIVARELKKPCIIGTKVATKVLRDGMKVRVDANEGKVEIITP